MSMFSKLGSFFSIRDEDEDLYEDEPAPRGASSRSRMRGVGPAPK